MTVRETTIESDVVTPVDGPVSPGTETLMDGPVTPSTVTSEDSPVTLTDIGDTVTAEDTQGETNWDGWDADTWEWDWGFKHTTGRSCVKKRGGSYKEQKVWKL